MSQRWKVILPGAFLAFGLCMLVVFNAARPRIMVLQSVGAESEWARGVDAGVRAALQSNRRPVSVEWQYLGVDTRSAAGVRATAAAEAWRAVDRFDPDVLIAVDDEANESVAREFAGRGGARVVFVSTDAAPAEYGFAGRTNVAGIAELLPLSAVRDAFRFTVGDRPLRVSAVAFDGPTGRAELAQVRAFDWSPHRLVETAAVGSLDAWKGFVESRGADADVLLVLSYAGLPLHDGDPVVADGPAIAAWTEEHSRPFPLGLHGSYVTHGGGLAIAPSPHDYGFLAMEMALDWVDPSNGSAPPPLVTSAHFDVAVGAARLKARGIPVPPIYLEAARMGDRLLP